MHAESLKKLVVGALEDLKALDLIVLDVKLQTHITDYMIICSGSSNRHVSSLADSVIEKAKQQNVYILGIEGKEQGEWTLIDLGDVVVHIMQPHIRNFYALEKLWGESETSASHL